MDASDYQGLLRQAAERLESAHSLRERLGAVRGTATSEDGRIRAEVLPGGRLESLELDPRVRRLPSEELATAIVEVVQRATADATTRAGELLEETLPGAGAGVSGLSDPAALADSRAASESRITEALEAMRRAFERR